MEVKKLQLEKEMYDEAREQGLSFAEFLEQQDPSEGYKKDSGASSELSELTAFERQLMAHDIKVGDGNASLVDQFFVTNASRVLFPEYLNQQILIGLRMGKLYAKLEDIVATTTQIEGASYKAAEIDLGKTDVKLKKVLEGAVL